MFDYQHRVKCEFSENIGNLNGDIIDGILSKQHRKYVISKIRVIRKQGNGWE